MKLFISFANLIEKNPRGPQKGLSLHLPNRACGQPHQLMWARLQLWNLTHSCWHVWRSLRLLWKGGGATANVSECLGLANKCRHLIGGLDQGVNYQPFTSLFTSSWCVSGLKKLHGSCLNHDTCGRMIFIRGGPTKLLLGGVSLDSILTFSSFSPLTLKNTAFSHTSVDAANVVRESRQRYNYHQSAN